MKEGHEVRLLHEQPPVGNGYVTVRPLLSVRRAISRIGLRIWVDASRRGTLVNLFKPHQGVSSRLPS